ncbi:MAG: hypothetical protein KatS3mg034_0725 [Vicingaceae bacterium]|nr:MAG: hypothetical protein KatS3mg034_0725 [Vicingaceae bacterium]
MIADYQLLNIRKCQSQEEDRTVKEMVVAIATKVALFFIFTHF